MNFIIKALIFVYLFPVKWPETKYNNIYSYSQYSTRNGVYAVLLKVDTYRNSIYLLKFILIQQASLSFRAQSTGAVEYAWLHLCRGIRPILDATSILFMTLSHPMVTLHIWSFKECRVQQYSHYSQVHCVQEL